jgi:ketosteroid isomerase-like protein
VFGAKAVRDFWEKYAEAIGREVGLQELIDAGDRVLARFKVRWRGEHSGAEGEMAWTAVGTLRNGKVIMVEWFLDHGQALEAVGLRE